MLRLDHLAAAVAAWWLVAMTGVGCRKAGPPDSPPPAAESVTSRPAQSASAAAPASAPPPEPSSSSSVPAPLPHVRVTNIGMHIGGGPNDSATKAPIRASVEPHFDEFRRCYALVEAPKGAGDFGVDLRIPRGGGQAEVRTPRTVLGGPEFARCMVDAFARIDFKRPLGGDTVVSYSLRFSPE